MMVASIPDLHLEITESTCTQTTNKATIEEIVHYKSRTKAEKIAERVLPKKAQKKQTIKQLSQILLFN